MSGRNRQQMVWRIFRVQPQKEFVAARMLAQAKYRVKVPVELRLRRKSRYCKGKKKTAYPLLIGYVFVKLPRDYPVSLLWDRFDCVKQPVAFGDAYLAAVPEAAMSFLRKLAKLNNPHRSSVNTRASFAIGDPVIITDGPFAGWTARVEQIRGEKAQLVLPLLGSQRGIDIPCEQLQGC